MTKLHALLATKVFYALLKDKQGVEHKIDLPADRKGADRNDVGWVALQCRKRGIKLSVDTTVELWSEDFNIKITNYTL